MVRPPAHKKFGNLLRRHLSDLGTRPDGITHLWTVKDFAEAIAKDLNLKTVQNWLDGRNLPTRVNMGKIEIALFGNSRDHEKAKRELRDARVAAPPPPPGPKLIGSAAARNAAPPAPEPPGPAPAEGAAAEAVAAVPSPPAPTNPNLDKWITTSAQVPLQPPACIPEIGIGELVEVRTVNREELAAPMAEAQQKIRAAKAPWWHAATVTLPLCALSLLGIIGDGRAFHDLCITVPQALAAAPFTVRHVRDGVGDLHEPPYYKEELRLPSPDRSGGTCQTLWFPRHAGFTFKVYVVYDGMEFKDVKRILEDSGYTHVTPDDQPWANNAWFIIPRYTTLHHSGYYDNTYLDIDSRRQQRLERAASADLQGGASP